MFSYDDHIFFKWLNSAIIILEDVVTLGESWAL